MKMAKGCALLVAAAVLAGCSTAPVKDGQARAVPADRIYMPDFLKASQERSATVDIARDKGFSGSGCTHDIFVNNQKVLAIRQAETATIHLAPGAYFIKLETGGGLCPNIATSQNLTLADGERQAYRILIPSDGNLRLSREQ
jgi:hypothetical protein